MPPVTSSPRPKPRPSAPTMSIRPKANPFKDPMSPASIADRTTRPLKKGGEVIAKKAASKKGKTY